MYEQVLHGCIDIYMCLHLNEEKLEHVNVKAKAWPCSQSKTEIKTGWLCQA